MCAKGPVFETDYIRYIVFWGTICIDFIFICYIIVHSSKLQ